MPVLAGCGTPPPATVAIGDPSPMPSEVIAIGDWDDADAAVRTAVRVQQMVIESRNAYRKIGEEEEGTIVYTLRTVRGDSGELSLKNLDGDEIRIRCRIGVIGSAQAERKLVSGLVSRLKQLHGKTHAPVRD